MSSAEADRPSSDDFYGLDCVFEDIVLHEAIGHGSYGKVYKAHYKASPRALIDWVELS